MSHPVRNVNAMTFVPPEKDEWEDHAAQTVAALLDGTPTRRDVVGAPQRTHDFDVVTSAGRIVALEVTSRVDAAVAAFWKGNRSLIDPTGLTYSWSLTVPHPVGSPTDPRLRDLARHAPGFLASVEPHLPPGCVELMGSLENLEGTPAHDAALGLKSLRVINANPLPRFGGVTSQAALGTSGHPREVPLARVITEAIAANAEKLARATADERHLFLWVDNSDTPNWNRLYLEQEPLVGPEYGPCIDMVWVALWSRNYFPYSSAAKIWRILRSGFWERVPVPEVRSRVRDGGSRIDAA